MPASVAAAARLLVAAAALLLNLPPAVAQTAAPMQLRIEPPQLQQERQSVQQPLDELPEGRAAAALYNRLTALEEELRRLTGRVEEAEFRDQQTRERIDRLVADLDRRLAALEQRPSAASDGAGQMPEALAASPGTSEPADPDAPAVSRIIPRDALLGIPAPNDEPPSGIAPSAALEGTSTQRFSAALDLLQAGDYAAAAVAFSRWVEDFGEDPQAPVAAYWLGEAQLANGDPANAAATFAANFRTFGADAPRAPDTLLKLGTALAAMGDTTRACQTFAELERRYERLSSGLRQALERERIAAGCG